MIASDMSDDQKICHSCKQAWPTSHFYKASRMTEGIANQCIYCKRARSRRNRAARIEQYRTYDRKRGWRTSSIEKRRARKAVWDAVARGELMRGPCAVCGCASVDGHHENYDEPLVVIWLCRQHHMAVHAKLFPLQAVQNSGVPFA